MIISEEVLIQEIRKAKRVLLLEPPFPRKYPPLSLAKISTLCKKHNIETVYSRHMVYEKFDLILMSTLFTYYSDVVKDTINSRGLYHRNTPIIVGGVFASLMPKFFDQFKNLNTYVGYSKELDYNIPDRSIMDQADPPWDSFSWVFTSRGCPNRCFTGDTLVNTVLGDIPIKDLVGKKTGVYTYDQATKNVYIADAIHIREMGIHNIVRVSFDDGTHIDCTPDQRFLCFKNGNQSVPTREYEKQAIDLVPGESVRAFKFTKTPQGYVNVEWGRRKRKLQHRMVAEYYFERELAAKEVVHHIDGVKEHNHPLNLEISDNMGSHIREHHPEISERMRKNNPRKFLTAEGIARGAAKIRGQKRGMATRMKHRALMLGENNPNFKDGRTAGQKSRIPGINHKVVSVMPIGSGMTYDLEVPSTGWFFANNVLVHNCAYCAVWRIEKERWINPKWQDHIFDDKPNILISDNNLSGTTKEHFHTIIDYANAKGKAIMFEGGVDCKYVDMDFAKKLASAKYVRHGLRMAFDRIDEDGIFQTAVRNLVKAGVSTESNMEVFLLFNFDDNPRDAYYRGKEAYHLGIHQVYPMFYRPLNALSKANPFVGKHWTFNLARAFRMYWLQRRWFKYYSFEQYIELQGTREMFNLTDEDMDKWYNPTVPFHEVTERKLIIKKR